MLDVVLFADMLDNKDPKRLLCVPIPFCYHCVTASLSLVLVIFFPRFSVIVSSFATLRPSILFASSSINRRRPLHRMLVMCFSNLLW